MSLQRQRGAGLPEPFTDPGELRRRLQRNLADAPVATREQALAIAASIEELLAAHRRKTEAVMQKYVDNMQTRYRDADALAETLAPLDTARLEVLAGIVDKREQLRQLLTPEQWQACFVD